MGNYTLFQVDGQDVAGMMNPLTESSRGKQPFWSAYVEVACVANVTELGGAVIKASEGIASIGRLCTITDPAGAPICLITPAPPAGA